MVDEQKKPGGDDMDTKVKDTLALAHLDFPEKGDFELWYHGFEMGLRRGIDLALEITKEVADGKSNS